MSKPGVLPGRVRRPSAEMQTHIAHAEVKLKLYHLGQPWACGIALLVLSAVLHTFFRGFWTAFLVAAAGLLVTIFDYRMRASRIHWEARAIGPVTILAATGWLVAAISFPPAVSLAWIGFSKPMFLAWFIGWLLGGIVWNGWMLSGEHKDETRQFPAAAANAGLGGTWFSGLRRRGKDKDTSKNSDSTKRAGGRGALVATMHLPPGQITPANAAAKIDNLEGALGYPPGSVSLAPDLSHASNTQMKVSDPQILDREPLPWPYGMEGSNPGASIADPINPGLWQDSEHVEYCVLNHHLLIIGVTNSGKTMTAAYNMIGEAITRVDYACLAFDIGKGEQFLGPMRPALHRLATTPEEAFKLLNAIHRIRSARAEYLASKNLTEWRPGCGLTFLEFFGEEAADLADMIVNKDLGGTKEQMEQWKSDLRAYRSIGGRWVLSTQRPDFQEIPTMLRSQMRRMCFGVENAAEAELGLSDEQRRRGCRPQLFKTDYPGKFFIDAPSIPDDRIGMAARGWYWGPGSSLMTAFAAQHPASARPLDDVTGEALEAEPSPAATSAFSVTPAMMQAGAGLTSPGPIAGERPPLYAVPDGWRPPKLAKERALDIVRQRLAELRADWKSDRPQLIKRSDLNDLAKQLDRSSQQMGNYLNMLVTNPAELLVKRDDIKQGYYQILPEPVQREGTE